MATDAADEERLLADAIAALDCLLEEVGQQGDAGLPPSEPPLLLPTPPEQAWATRAAAAAALARRTPVGQTSSVPGGGLYDYGRDGGGGGGGAGLYGLAVAAQLSSLSQPASTVQAPLYDRPPPLAGQHQQHQHQHQQHQQHQPYQQHQHQQHQPQQQHDSQPPKLQPHAHAPQPHTQAAWVRSQSTPADPHPPPPPPALLPLPPLPPPLPPPLLPPPPPVVGRVGRRRSDLYGVTREQDERLARAVERAMRMSGGGGGGGQGGEGAAWPAAGAARLGVEPSVRGGVFQRESAGPGSVTMDTSTELLNDLLGDELANRQGEGQAPRGSAPFRGGARPPGARPPLQRGGSARRGRPEGAGGDDAQAGMLGREQGVTLWSGNKSKVERARLAVRLLQATGLSRSREDRHIDPYAEVSCEEGRRHSRAVHKCKDPNWDEFFVFDVRQPASAVLTIKVYDHMRCWRPAFLGHLSIPVQSIAQLPDHHSQPAWHPLRSRAGKLRGGMVQVQLFYTAEWVHRPLRVLAATWNVGNAEPPADLGPWLQGVETLQHDLVAIGVQECMYKAGGGAATAADDDFYTALQSAGGSVLPPLAAFGGVDEGALAALLAGQMSGLGGSPHSDPSGGGGGTPTANGTTANGTPTANGATAAGGGGGESDGAMNPSVSPRHPSGPCRSPQHFRFTAPGLASPFGAASASHLAGPPDISRHGSRTGGGGTEGGALPLSPAGSGLVTREGSSSLGPPPRVGAGRGRRGSQVLMALLQRADTSGSASPLPPPPPGFFSAQSRRRHSTMDPSAAARAFLASPHHSAADPAALAAALAVAAAGTGAAPRRPPPISLLQSAPTFAHLAGGGGEPAPHHHAASFTSPQHPAGGGGGGGGGGSFTAGGTASPSFTSAPGTPRAAPTSPLLLRQGTMRSGGAGGKAPGQTIKSRGVSAVTDMAKVGGEFRDLWEERLKEAVGPGYFMVASSHMGQIRILLFARNDIYAAVSDVRTGKQATGVAGVATNKGGVGISLRVWDTTLAFVNSHLAAHQDKTRARNSNYRDITRGLKLDPTGRMDVLTAFHHVVWMGDLNYRLDYGQQAVTPTESPTPEDYWGLVGAVHGGHFSQLLQVDQLRREMAARRAFLGFQEGHIDWEPSFKVLRRRGCDYNPQRSPAYCDRVLFRSNLPLKQIRPVSYFSPAEICSSDHKPVAAVLLVPTVWRNTVVEAAAAGGGGGSGRTAPARTASADLRAAAAQPLAHMASLFRRPHQSARVASSHAPGHRPPAPDEAAGPHPHPHPGPGPGPGRGQGGPSRIRLHFLHLHAHGLYMLRSRRRSAAASTEFPSPQLLFTAPCMRDAVVASRVAPRTREPVWAQPLDPWGSGLGPLSLELHAAALSEMAHFRLLVRVMDARGKAAAAGGAGSEGASSRGGGGGGGGGGHVLARCVLPLTDAATLLLKDARGVAAFSIPLELHGLPAGTLEGTMRLEVFGPEHPHGPAGRHPANHAGGDAAEANHPHWGGGDAPRGAVRRWSSQRAVCRPEGAAHAAVGDAAPAADGGGGGGGDGGGVGGEGERSSAASGGGGFLTALRRSLSRA